MRAHRPTQLFASLCATTLCAAIVLFSAAPSAAEWEGSRGEDIVAISIDGLIVRPLAMARVVVGAILSVPAIILASPSGREGIEGAYDILIVEPFEYAFTRKVGDF